ncbi:MAG TPA: alpha/beta fold hydrolase [Thermoanaerobaculia bacterium]|nr:alpha/beta fold hydrolase [Thermoanaerobaculia bacterium]
MNAREVVLAPTTPTSPSLLRTAFRALCTIAPGLATKLAFRLWFTPSRPRVSDSMRAFLATGESLNLTVNGRHVAAWTWGTGRTIVLSHGWGGYAAQMQSFVEPLTRAGFRVVAFDAPAHGQSGASRLGSRKSTFFDFGEVLAELSQRYDVAGLVAHSGGCTAASLAMRAGWRVPAAVFIAPMASPLAYRQMFEQALGMTDDVAQRFSDEVERRLNARWEEFEVPSLAQAIDTPPLLVIHDRDDRETSWREGAEIADAWPNARLVTTTGLGHRRLLRDASVVAGVVRFFTAS